MENLLAELAPWVRVVVFSTLKASVMIALILAIRALGRDRLSSHWLYVLWMMVVIRLIFPWSLPSRLSVFNLMTSDQRATRPVALSMEVSADTPPMPTVSPDDSKPLIIVSESSLPADDVRAPHQAWTWGDGLSMVWLLGTLIVISWAVFTDLWLWSRVRTLRNITDGEVLEVFEDCKQEMGIHTVVGLVLTDQVASPCLFGVLRPRLLLPLGTLESLSKEQLRHVFLHEFAHMRRFDILTGWLMLLMQSLHWFNPLVWLAIHRMRTDREVICDRFVLRTMQEDEKDQYGLTIMDLSVNLPSLRLIPSVAGIGEHRSLLKRRITMISKYNEHRFQQQAWVSLLLVLFALVTLTDASPTPLRSMAVANMPEALYQSLVLYYSFDRDRGAKVVDDSGMGFHGQPFRTRHMRQGRVGGAMAFNGHNSQIVIDKVKLNDFTFAAWVRRDMDHIGNRVLMQLYNGNESISIQAGFSVCIGRQPEIGDNYPGRGIFDKGQWNHVVVTFDGRRVTIYRDGQFFNEGPANGMGLISGPLYIGGTDVWRPENAGFWQGALDEVALFNRALSSEEVMELCQLCGLSLGNADEEETQFFENDRKAWSLKTKNGGRKAEDALSISPQTWYEGSFDERGDERWYQIKVNKGSVYNLTMDDEFGSGKYNADPILEIYEYDGHEHTCLFTETRNTLYVSPLEFKAQDSGTIYIRIVSDNPNDTTFALGFSASQGERKKSVLEPMMY